MTREEYINTLELDNAELKKENKELKSQLSGTTHCFDEEEHRKLKKQLEEWEHHLKCSKEMLDVQAQKGNYDYDEYMLGLYNGMEYIISLFETREPNYINGKDVEFTNNKSQQKEFIDYLQKEINRYNAHIDAVNSVGVSIYSTDYDNSKLKLAIFKEVLLKYIEITQTKNDNSVRIERKGDKMSAMEEK